MIRIDPGRSPGHWLRSSSPQMELRSPRSASEAESAGRNEEVRPSLIQVQILRRTGAQMSTSAARSELRLVVLGRAETGRRAAVCSILDLQDGEQGTDASPGDTEECSRERGESAGRQVVVVSSADWFGSDSDPNERSRHISALIALSRPGPHAFLLCVPVDRPADGEARALDVLTELLGPSAVAAHTIILFTHTEDLEEGESLEQYLVTWRKDLRELVERCGGRYLTLEGRGEEAEERKAVEELLEKVELAVAGSGTQHFSCPLYQEAEEKVREKQVELVRQRRGEEPPADPPQEENVTEEEMEAVREEAERSVDTLSVNVDGLFPSAPVSTSSSRPSLLWGWWETLSGWMKWLPTLVRREALLGALVGLFLGGPVGGVVGASVGSIATEMKRRRAQKTK